MKQVSKSLRHISFYLVLTWFSILPVKCQNLTYWKKIQTVEDICSVFPERMKSLLHQLNLNDIKYTEIKSAFENGQIEVACKFLLDYYLQGNTANFLRREIPAYSNAINQTADLIVENRFSFYNQSASVPYNENGHIDWTFKGPANDIEWTWALNRHFHIQTLFDAYMETGNPLYAKTLDTHIKDWIISSLPYPNIKNNTSMWRGLEVSFRLKTWANIFFGLMGSDHLSPATQLLMLSSLPEHAHYLQNFHGRGNWLSMEMSALAMAATAWPEFKNAADWLQYSIGSMRQGLEDQVYPDGVQNELTSSYHYVALNNFNQFFEICQHANQSLPGLFKNYLEKMWNYMAYTLRPDGNGLLNNDSDLKNNREIILKAATDYNRDDWKYIATNGRQGSKPIYGPSAFYPWAGHMITRSGYDTDAQWSFFDVGPWGTSHQHNDKLHLSVSAYGRDLLVDAGRFAYRGEVADKFREYACGSSSHNIILIDGQGQAPGPLLAVQPLTDEFYKIEDRFDYAWNSFEQFENLEGECRHTRALFYVRGKFWVILDHINTDRPRKIETLWHWHPDCNVVIQKNKVVSSRNERGNLKIIPVGSSNWSVRSVTGQEKPNIQGWYSKQYNEVEPNITRIYSTEIQKSTAFVWILYPSEGKSQILKSKVISEQQDELNLRVTIPGEGEWDLRIPYWNSKNASLQFSPNISKK